MVSKLVNLLDGKKTYIGAAIIFIAGGLKALGKIDDNQFQVALSIGGAVSVMGVRAAVAKLQ